jgi:hypothetical protein
MRGTVMKTTMIALLFGMAGTQMSVAGELVKTSDCQGATKLADGSIQIKSFDGPNGKMTDMRIGPRKTDAGATDLYGEFDRICFSGKSEFDQPAAPR